MPLTRRTLLQQVAVASLPLSAGAMRPESAFAATIPYADNEPVVITLLHTNDLHGHIWHPEEAQGLVRLATLIQAVRADMPNVVLLDGGDIIHGTPESKAFHGKAALDAMNALQYDVATVGNHEFDFGQSVLRDTIAYARFPMLSANVVETKSGSPWGSLKPWTVLTRSGVRIGVFGLTTPTTVQIEWPRTLDGIRFTDPFVAARKAIAELRDQERADVIVALSHLGYEEDRKLAATVTGMDVIIGSHSHTMLSEQVWINGVLIAQTGAYGKALGRIDLLVQKASGADYGRVLDINGKDDKWWGTNSVAAPLQKRFPSTPLLKPESTTAEEPTTLQAYRPWSEKLRPSLREILATAAEPLSARDATTRETALGNLFADAIRAATKTKIALMSSSQINSVGIPSGPVTVETLYQVLGSYTRQHLVVARVPGAAIEHVLTTVRSGPNAGHYPIHLSGIMVAADGTIRVGQSPLDPDRRYTLSSAAHVIQDYFYEKPWVEIVSDAVDAATVRDAVISYLRGHTPLHNDLSTHRWLP